MRAHISTGEGLWEEVDVTVFQEPLCKADLETLGSQGDARHVLETGQGVTLRNIDVKTVEERGEEQEQFHPGEDVAEAHPAA